jgi:hypothetical protein
VREKGAWLLRISQELKENLLSELEFVILKMRGEPDAVKKLYFFSATYGAVERAMRLCLDNELIIAHAIITICYNTVNDRVNRVKMGDTSVSLPQDFFERLIDGVSSFRQAIEQNESLYPSLETIMRLTYATTGPGFYTQSYLDYVNSRPT